MTSGPTSPTWRKRMRLGAATAALLALAACGGGGGDDLRCPAGFTGVEPPIGDNLAVCVIGGRAQAYDIQDYPADVTATGAIGSSDYVLTLATPGYTLPSPQTLAATAPAGTDKIGEYNVYVVDKVTTSGTVSTLHRVYSFARDPGAPAGGALPVPLSLTHVDYGMWEAGRVDSTIPALLAYYRGPWMLPKAGVRQGAPAANASFGGFAFVNHVDREVGTFARSNVSAFSFNGAEAKLTGTIPAMIYDASVALPPRQLPALTLTSTSVDLGSGAVTGKITGPATFGDPPEIGRFEGFFAGPGGEEFVARITVYLSAPAANPPVRAVGFIALKKE